MHLQRGVKWPWQEEAGISELGKAELVFVVRNRIPSAL